MFAKVLAEKIITRPGLYTKPLILSPYRSGWVESAIVNLQKFALVQADFFSEDDWQAIQLKKLKTILAHAGRTVPYWQKLFKKINFAPETLRGFSDLKKIPIVTRREFKKTPIEELVDRTAPQKCFVKAFTSGSTGEPLLFYQDAQEIFWRRSGILKELHNFELVLKRPALILGLSTHKLLDKFGFRFRSADLEIYDQWLKILYPFIYNRKPEVLIGTPSLLNRFVFFLEKYGVHPLQFKIIRYTGESMSQEERNALSKKFGCPVFTQYGTRECSYIGMECGAGKLHLTPWLNYVEIVDEAGVPLPWGRSGRIVVTYFENRVMPFIRYDIGDRGMIRKEPCACGRSTPTIEFIGRVPGMIELPSGKQVPVLRITTKIAKGFHREIARFQMEQTARNTFIFRFIPTNYYSAKTGDALQAYFQGLFGDEMKCTFERVEHIHPNAEDKTPVFIKGHERLDGKN